MALNEIIGIDPDFEASGVALFRGGELDYSGTMPFFALIEFLNNHRDALVLIEAGWLNRKKNWHVAGWNAEKRERVAYNVGMNHTIGRLIEKFCIENAIQYQLIKPTSSKLRKEYFEQVTGIEKRTNQDERDAVMIVLRKMGNLGKN
jgi:hypothetical protein